MPGPEADPEERSPPPARFGARDALDQAAGAILAQPGRSLLTVGATVAGVAALVAIVSLTTTAGAQIGERFDALAATEVIVEDPADQGSTGTDQPALPADAGERLGRLNGVVSAGRTWTVTAPEASVAARPVSPDADAPVSIVAAAPGALEVFGLQIDRGRTYDRFHEETAARVAVVGRSVARRLDLADLSLQPAVFVGGTAFTVIGVVGDASRNPEVLSSVVVPASTAIDVWGEPLGTPIRVAIETEPGAAQLVADQAPYALRPTQPDTLAVLAPPDPDSLRTQVGTDVGALLLGVAGVTVVLGALGISNTTLAAVLERVSEIGLRRALGARRIHVAAQFLVESGVLGTVGGIAGASLGILVVVGVAAARSWTVVIEPLAVVPAPLLGTVTGLLAGLYPALRASRIEPVEALRR